MFTLASIIERNPEVQYPFVTNHLYLWEIFTSGYAAFFIALERNSEKIKGGFLANIFKKAIPAAAILTSAVLFSFLFYVLQRNGLVNWGIYNRNTAIAMGILAFSILGLAVLYRVCCPLTKYRRIVFACVVAVNAVFILVTSIVSVVNQITEPVLQIPYIELSGPAILVMSFIIAILAGIYILSYRVWNAIKGRDE